MDGMKQAFDTMADGFRSGFDAGRKAQEALFEAWGDAMKAPTGLDTMFTRPEQFFKGWLPFFAKNTRTMVDCMDANFRAGMDVFRTACDASMKVEDADFYKKSRSVWDATFDAARVNFDTVGKAGKAAMENWTNLCQTTCQEQGMGKSMPKAQSK